MNRIFESVPIDKQGLDAALAVLRLARRYSAERVDASCQLALAGRVRSPRYAHLQPILATGQDQTASLHPPREESAEGSPAPGSPIWAARWPVFCTQYAKKDLHQRLGSGVHADAIMDRIVHNTIRVDTGNRNMREHAIVTQ